MKTLALDIGGTKIASSVVNSDGRMSEISVSPTRVESGPQAVFSEIKKICQTAIARNQDISAVSLSSAGPLDLNTGSWLSPTNFLTDGKHWGRVHLVGPLREVIGLPVFLDNDAACAALGHHLLEKGRVEDLVVITLGTGVGVGVLVQGELARTGDLGHPEVSHIPLRAGDPAAPCECGLYGCIEAYLSSTHFARRQSRARGTELKTEDVVQAARAKEKWALDAFDVYAMDLAHTFMIFKTLYQPQMIVISGGLSSVSELYFANATSKFNELVALLKSPSPAVEFKVSPYPFELSLFGAAAKAFRALNG